MKNLFRHLLDKASSTYQAITKKNGKVVHVREKFIDLIRLERERVHRNDRQFSLILIKVVKDENENTANIELAHKISKRVRRIDQIGWYDNTHLGVLLPNTTIAGAKTVAKDIFRDKAAMNSVIDFATLCYPDKS